MIQVWLLPTDSTSSVNVQYVPYSSTGSATAITPTNAYKLKTRYLCYFAFDVCYELRVRSSMAVWQFVPLSARPIILESHVNVRKETVGMPSQFASI